MILARTAAVFPLPAAGGRSLKIQISRALYLAKGTSALTLPLYLSGLWLKKNLVSNFSPKGQTAIFKPKSLLAYGRLALAHPQISLVFQPTSRLGDPNALAHPALAHPQISLVFQPTSRLGDPNALAHPQKSLVFSLEFSFFIMQLVSIIRVLVALERNDAPPISIRRCVS